MAGASRSSPSSTGHAMAKAGLEGAVWDLWAKREGVFLEPALGRHGRPHCPPQRWWGLWRIRTGCLAGGGRSWHKATRRHQAQGTSGRRRRWRRSGRPLAPLRWPWTPTGLRDEDLLPALQGLDEFGLDIIEQPLPWDDLVGRARLCRRGFLPLLSCGQAPTGRRPTPPRPSTWASGRIFNLRPGAWVVSRPPWPSMTFAMPMGSPVGAEASWNTGIGHAHDVGAGLPCRASPCRGTCVALEVSSGRHGGAGLGAGPGRAPAVPQGPGIGVAVRREQLARVPVVADSPALVPRAAHGRLPAARDPDGKSTLGKPAAGGNPAACGRSSRTPAGGSGGQKEEGGHRRVI